MYISADFFRLLSHKFPEVEIVVPVGMHKYFVRYPTRNNHLVIKTKYLSGTFLGPRLVVVKKRVSPFLTFIELTVSQQKWP